MKVYPVLCAVLLIISCGGGTLIDTAYINDRSDSLVSSLRKDRRNYYQLADKRVGNDGFYYIIDREGIVIFHPQAVLIGADLKGHWFINEVLKLESGCLHYQMGGLSHLVFFRPINDREILCLSIPSSQVSDYTAGCRSIEK